MDPHQMMALHMEANDPQKLRRRIDDLEEEISRLKCAHSDAWCKVTECEEYMWDAMWQGCYQGNDEHGFFLDNQCMGTYEGLTHYFAEHGRLTTKNGRIYRLVEPKE